MTSTAIIYEEFTKRMNDLKNRYSLNDNVTISFNDDDVNLKLLNCDMTITKCNTCFDCHSKCKNGTTYFCNEKKWCQRSSNVAECNADKGGVRLLRMTQSGLTPHCLCTMPDVWQGPGCEEPNPYFCNGGNIRWSITQKKWICECTDGWAVSISINRNVPTSRRRHFCARSKTKSMFFEVNPESLG